MFGEYNLQIGVILGRTVRELPQDVYNPRFLVPVPKNWSSDKHAKVYNKAASNVNKKVFLSFVNSYIFRVFPVASSQGKKSTCEE